MLFEGVEAIKTGYWEKCNHELGNDSVTKPAWMWRAARLGKQPPHLLCFLNPLDSQT